MRPNLFHRTTRGLGVAALSLLAPSAALPAENFPVELYPQLKDKSESEIRLAGIAALCPGRVLDAAPTPPVREAPELRKTRVAELPRGGAYVRLYTLDAESVRERAVRPGGLVVDFRYLQTSPADTAAVAELAAALGAAPRWRSVGDHPAPGAASRPPVVRGAPVLALVNGRTSGPLEVALASLRASGAVRLVGSRTAGATGVYKPFAAAPGRFILSGELLPEGVASPVGVGVTPDFPVTVSPEDEFSAWQAVERGAPLGAVLPRETIGRTEAAKNGAEARDAGANGKPAEKAAEITDPSLARAQDVLAALRVLGGA